MSLNPAIPRCAIAHPPVCDCTSGASVFAPARNLEHLARGLTDASAKAGLLGAVCARSVLQTSLKERQNHGRPSDGRGCRSTMPGIGQPRSNAAMGGHDGSRCRSTRIRSRLLDGEFRDARARPGTAIAAGAVLDQPWAVWDKNAKPVRGGIYRIATEQYIGKINPNHWPVLDWISMGYFHERLMVTDGSLQSDRAVARRALELGVTPQEVVMRLRDGVTFHDGSPFDAKGVKYQFDWIRDPCKQDMGRELAGAARYRRGGRRANAALEIQDAVGRLQRRHSQRSRLCDVGEGAAGGRGQVRQPAAGHRSLYARGGKPGQFSEVQAQPELVVRQGQQQSRHALLRRHPGHDHSRSGGEARQSARRQDRRI